MQRCAVKVILQERYTDYDSALSDLSLSKLSDRREEICLTFAKSCTQNRKTTDWFPLKNEHEHFNRMRYMKLNLPTLKDSETQLCHIYKDF